MVHLNYFVDFYVYLRESNRSKETVEEVSSLARKVRVVVGRNMLPVTIKVSVNTGDLVVHSFVS